MNAQNYPSSNRLSEIFGREAKIIIPQSIYSKPFPHKLFLQNTPKPNQPIPSKKYQQLSLINSFFIITGKEAIFSSREPDKSTTKFTGNLKRDEL